MSAPAPLPYAFAKRHGVVVLASGDDGAPPRVGLRAGADPRALVEVRRVLGPLAAVEAMAAGAFDRRLAEAYADAGIGGAVDVDDLERLGSLDRVASALPADDLLESQDDAPVIRLINALIAEGVRGGASDIHIEPFESSLRVRLRVDGMMREALRLPHRIAPLLVSRIKVMARLDIAEKRIPQDGRISVTMGSKPYDVRVSTLPARAGERVVLRLLDKDQGGLGLGELGMGAATLASVREALQLPNGIILVTGPTGSGKTTTLYAALALLNDGERNLLTVEDPVEYAIEGIGQTQVNARVGMTFATGLRAILRQDPDVVMVGEIRDVETAQVAVQASLTGHLVLSTVHTNDAPGAITRLRDMGIEPFLLASSLRLVVAQRLLRRLCAQCKAPRPADALAQRYFGSAPAPSWRAVGCPACQHGGYAGRVGIHEVLAVNERVRALVGADADEDAIARAAFGEGGRLADAARDAVLQGLTSIEEALRVAREEHQADAAV
ncbi:MAG: type II secretion system protein GspE [Lysobacteraceae bacterium]|nr:MAG: type II secretion system protein GspE [Xanthomonadaceae bacterium]